MSISLKNAALLMAN